MGIFTYLLQLFVIHVKIKCTKTVQSVRRIVSILLRGSYILSGIIYEDRL